MANPYYNEDFSGQPGQTARAESVATEFDGVQAGFDSVEADMIRAIRTTVAGEVMAALPNVANRANKFLKFDSAGNPIAVTTPLNVRGVWVANTVYVIGDAYTSTPNGSLYYVKAGYTSGATFGVVDLANTVVLVNLGGLLFVNNIIINAAGTYPLASGQSILVDSSAGAIVFNLPTAPVVGDSPVNITYIGGTLTGSQTVTISSGANKIMGATDNTLDLDITNASCTIMWAGVAYGWRLRVMG